jgi:hypothetical protein
MTGYEDYRVGDRVYCLAWLGKLFEIVAKDDQNGKISLRGDLVTQPGGAQIDIFPSTMYQLSHEPREDIWNWPDRKGEQYLDVFERFRSKHKPGDIITGHLVEGASPLEPIGMAPERAMAFRIVIPIEASVVVEPVVGLNPDGKSFVKEATNDPAIRWVSVGPITPARVGMIAYRWSISFGDVVLNGEDFNGLS